LNSNLPKLRKHIKISAKNLWSLLFGSQQLELAHPEGSESETFTRGVLSLSTGAILNCARKKFCNWWFPRDVVTLQLSNSRNRMAWRKRRHREKSYSFLDLVVNSFFYKMMNRNSMSSNVYTLFSFIVILGHLDITKKNNNNKK